jgi:sugar/nucleoside kinase (ribokinase family)
VLSEEDVAQDEGAVRNLAAMARVTAVTRGRAGATIYWQGLSCDLPAFRAREVDPTGAGDVFAAAFLVRLHETGDPFAAAQFANCAASLSIEGAGTAGIPSRRQVEARLRCPEFYE